MSTPYVGEIRLFAGNFAPSGWALCAGQLLPISENDTLFALIGTSFGGDGQSTFALPDLRGRVPVHRGPVNTLAQSGGTETVTLTGAQLPSHRHAFIASAAAGSASAPQGAVLATTVGNIYHSQPTSLVPLGTASVTAVGGSQPHENMQPFLCMNYIISLFGIFPSQT